MSSQQNNTLDAELDKKLKRASHARVKPGFDYSVESLGETPAKSSRARRSSDRSHAASSTSQTAGGVKSFEESLDFDFDSVAENPTVFSAKVASYGKNVSGQASKDGDSLASPKEAASENGPDDAAEKRRAERKAKREAREAKKEEPSPKESDSVQAPRAKRSSSTSKDDAKPEPKTVAEHLMVFGGKHEVLVGIGICLFAVVAITLTFWFVVFSGIASSADFLYNQF